MSSTVLLPPDVPGLLHLPAAFNYAAAGILSRTVLTDGGLRAVLFSFAAGQELTDHTSPARAVVIALDGEADFKVGGTTHLLRPGDLLHMPPQAPHAVVARTNFSMLLILHRTPRAQEAEQHPSGNSL